MDAAAALAILRYPDVNLVDRIQAAKDLHWWITNGGSVPADMSPVQVIKLSEMFVSINSYLRLI